MMDEAANSSSPIAGPPGPGWYPAAVSVDQVRWLFLPEAAFTDPFFEETLRRHRKNPSATTPRNALCSLDAAPFIPPASLIFHASRCGSTLVAQMLSCLDGCRCISEPPALDQLLAQLLTEVPSAEGIQQLRGLITAFGQPQTGIKHLFIKLDSWHVGALPLLQDAFPETPCWFLHRDPAAILRSHQKERGSQMVPGLVNLAPFGIKPGEIPAWDLDGYAAAVLGSILRTAAGHVRRGRLRAWDATTLPESLNEAWLAAHGVFPDAGSLARMKERAGFHSKRGYEPWQPGESDSTPIPAVEELRVLWQSLAQ